MSDIDETLPETVKAFLHRGAKLEEIRLHRDGRWTHEGLDFENRRIIELFQRSIGRTDGGTWVLEIGQFTYPIEVDDAPYFVEQIALDVVPARLAISDQTEETLDPASLRYAPEGRLYCRVKSNAFDARFKRPAYYDIAEQIEEAGDRWWFHHGDERHLIASEP